MTSFYERATAITGEKRIKKCEKTLDSAYGFHHPVATHERRTADGSGNSEK